MAIPTIQNVDEFNWIDKPSGYELSWTEPNWTAQIGVYVCNIIWRKVSFNFAFSSILMSIRVWIWHNCDIHQKNKTKDERKSMWKREIESNDEKTCWKIEYTRIEKSGIYTFWAKNLSNSLLCVAWWWTHILYIDIWWNGSFPSVFLPLLCSISFSRLRSEIVSSYFFVLSLFL